MNEQRSGRRRYEIVGALGKGGFGTVYQAQLLGEEGFRKTVALKVLNPGLLDQPELAARLRDEARILGLIRHRAVVQVDDLVRLEGNWTIVMEYVGGVDLGAVIKAGPVPPRPALEILQEAASALHVAWSTVGRDGRPLHLLHRDIKPGNLLVTPAGEVKVLDFGIARADFGEREGVTRSVGFGSPEYMSPERLEWQNGPESDIYALGCVLYELVTGNRFGISSGHPDRHLARVEEAAGAIQTLLGPPGEPVALLLRQLLTYEPADRPTARALERQCEGLVAALSGERLRDWAEHEIPKILEARPTLAQPGLTGRVLVEGTTKVPPPEQARGPGQAAVIRWVALGLLGSLLLLTAFGLAVYLAVRPEPAPATAPTPAAAVAAPTPEITPPAAPTPVIAPTQAPAPESARARKSQTEPERLAPTPGPAPSNTTDRGRVSVEGDAESVLLVRDGKSHAVPGELPPGTYSVTATFPGREPATAGQVSVVAGGKVVLNCSAAFKLCRAR